LLASYGLLNYRNYMKKLNILLLLTSIFWYSCNTPIENKLLKPVTITGKVLDYVPNKTEGEITFPKLCGENKRETITFDSCGNFTCSSINNIPSDIRISINKAYFIILAHPGDSIQIELVSNAPDFWKTISINGQRATENRQIIKFQKQFRSNSIKSEELAEARDTKNEEDFVSFMDSLRSKSMQKCEQFIQENNSNLEVENWIKWHVNPMYYSNMYWYPIYRNELELKGSFYQFQEKLLPIKRDMLTATKSLNLFIAQYYFGSIKPIIDEENNELFNQSKVTELKKDSVTIEEIINHSKGEFTKELVLSYWLSSKISTGNLKPYEYFIATKKSEISTDFIFENLDQFYNSTKRRLTSGSKSIVFADNTKGQSIKTILDSIKESYKDNIIVLDCWGTYCGPCIANFPNTKQLITDLKDQKIIFIFFCLNASADSERWTNLVNIHKLEGIHYCLDKEQSRDLKKILSIDGIPHYSIFDKSGILRGNSDLHLEKSELIKLINE